MLRVALSMLLLAGCPSDPPPVPSGPIVGPMTAIPVMTAAPLATAAPPADDDDDEDTECVVYPRRCEDGCKQAFFAGIARPENSWDPSLIPQDLATQLGTCVAGCIPHRPGEEMGCVGPGSEEECACREACERTAGFSQRISPDATVKIRRAARNLDAAIAPACR